MMNSNQVDMVYFLDRRMYDAKWVKILEKPKRSYLPHQKIISLQRKPDLPLTRLSLSPDFNGKGCQLPVYTGTVSGFG